LKNTYKFNEPPFGLHDMNLNKIKVDGNDLCLMTQSGMVKTSPPYSQIDGYIEVKNIDWDFCYVYLLDGNGNIGPFSGKKMYLKDFIGSYKVFGFSIYDITYGYNRLKLDGYLTANKCFYECFMEIYHAGDIIFVSE